MGAVEAKLLGRGRCRRYLCEDALPDATARPPRIPVVDRLGGTVFERNVSLATSGLRNMEDAGDHPPIIDAGLARLVFQQMRLQRRPRFIRQPKQIAHNDLWH